MFVCLSEKTDFLNSDFQVYLFLSSFSSLFFTFLLVPRSPSTQSWGSTFSYNTSESVVLLHHDRTFNLCLSPITSSYSVSLYQSFSIYLCDSILTVEFSNLFNAWWFIRHDPVYSSVNLFLFQLRWEVPRDPIEVYAFFKLKKFFWSVYDFLFTFLWKVEHHSFRKIVGFRSSIYSSSSSWHGFAFWWDVQIFCDFHFNFLFIIWSLFKSIV